MEPKFLDKVRSKCWHGKHPIVRVVMNLVDHPHEDGEGRAPIGRKILMTPWGYPTLGEEVRKIKDTVIVLFFIVITRQIEQVGT